MLKLGNFNPKKFKLAFRVGNNCAMFLQKETIYYTVELDYNDHGYNEQKFRKFLFLNGDFTT